MDELKNVIKKLKSSWKPKTKEAVATISHGSKEGDIIEYTLYFDVYRNEWTSERRAFQGFVFHYINSYLL